MVNKRLKDCPGNVWMWKVSQLLKQDHCWPRGYYLITPFIVFGSLLDYKFACWCLQCIWHGAWEGMETERKCPQSPDSPARSNSQSWPWWKGWVFKYGKGISLYLWINVLTFCVEFSCFFGAVISTVLHLWFADILLLIWFFRSFL